ncbi:hypothetical protein MNBD_GAMMA24-2339 [hydrothermal vent metagenome]|uniref:Fibronectin type-III domain-containing protein n=1 Tax=hydrothermal vent metagenome TaxID=652676 RepID=A0A3B1BPK4_9ZZZZ
MTNWVKSLLGICCFLLLLVACGGGQATNNGVPASSSAVEIPAVGSAISSATGVVTLSWLPPTENTDGSALTDLSGYKIYYGTSPDALTNTIALNNAGLTSYVVENLVVDANYYFAITAINSSEVQSGLSNVANKTVSG